MKRFSVVLLVLVLFISGNAQAVNKNKLKNPAGFIIKKDNDTTLYTADISTDNGLQIIDNTGCVVDIVPSLLYSDNHGAVFTVYFHLYSFSLPKPNLKISINANGSRFTFKPIGQSVSIYNTEQGTLYHLTCTMPVGNKGKKMLKDISLASGPILMTYEVTLDEKNTVLSGNMIDYHRQCFTRVRDLFVDCGAVNDDFSGFDEMISFKSESSK